MVRAHMTCERESCQKAKRCLFPGYCRHAPLDLGQHHGDNTAEYFAALFDEEESDDLEDKD